MIGLPNMLGGGSWWGRPMGYHDQRNQRAADHRLAMLGAQVRADRASREMGTSAAQLAMQRQLTLDEMRCLAMQDAPRFKPGDLIEANPAMFHMKPHTPKKSPERVAAEKELCDYLGVESIHEF